MTVEQIVVALAGSICAVGAAIAAFHREPRAAGAALAGTLVSLAVLYAALAAPVLAGAALALAVFLTLPLLVHLTIASPRSHAHSGPPASGAGLLIGAGLLAILLASVVVGEVPVNVSVRASDGYDVGALADLATGRGAVAGGVSLVALLAAVVAARAVGRDRRTPG